MRNFITEKIASTISDPRGFSYTISFENYNTITVMVNTSVDEYLIDVQLSTLFSYHDYLLRFLLSRKELETLTRDLFSIGWFRWNFIKIYRKIQEMWRKLFNILV